MVIGKKERQSKLDEFYVHSHQVGLDGNAYKILEDEKKKLKKKFKGTKRVSFSDSVRELKKRADNGKLK